MTAPLLKTKLYVPPLQPGLVPRPHLLARLEEGLRPGCNLVLLSAPPGFGKTTLLSQWIHGMGGEPVEADVAWLALDEGDNDLARFLSYLITALQVVRPGVGAAGLAAIRSPQPPQIEALLAGLINDLSEQHQSDKAGRPLALVLDDCHLLTARMVHSAIAFLLSHLPPGMRLILSTRADPPLPLARLRARGALVEIRIDDLRFTLGETTTLLNEVQGLGLAEEEVATLEVRTEGWGAGLQLAALALRGRGAIGESDSASHFVQAFAGDDRYVADYLVEEVLHSQPGHIRDFLMRTSILERMSAPLCDAILGGGPHDSQQVLENLESSNLFVTPLDNRRQWYRYHRLFSDLLRQRLQQAAPGLLADLHGRASRWYEANGLPAEAVDHALVGGDFERAADLMVPQAWALLSQGEMATLLGWLKALPERVIGDRPRLGLIHAWVLVSTVQLDAVDVHLRDLEGRLQGPETEHLLGEIAAIRATAASLRGDVPATVALSNQALAQLAREDMHLRGIVVNSLGAAYDTSGDAPAASKAFAEAAALSQASGNRLMALIALGNLARLQEIQGRLQEAAGTCRRALELAAQEGEPAPPSAGAADVQMGRLLCEWGDLDAAAQRVTEGMEQGRRAGVMELVVAGKMTLARVRRAQGKPAAAQDLIEEAQRLVDGFTISAGLARQVTAWQVRLWVAEGDLKAAERWAQNSGLGADDDPDPVHHAEYVALARLLIAQDRLDSAARLLGRLLQTADAQGRMGQAIELLALQALTSQALGEGAGATAALSRALSLGEPEGYRQVFVDEGPRLAPLFRAIRRERPAISAGYVHKLLTALEAVPSDHLGETGGPPPPPVLVEPLSDRELEVLRLVADGLSNREIAEALVLTVGTVKWHVHNLYGKLHVGRRTEAVARARELGLL